MSNAQPPHPSEHTPPGTVGGRLPQRRVGDSDLFVSSVGLGGNNFGPMFANGLDASASRAVVEAALDAGITLFDTGEGYSDGVSEQYLGRALKGRRDEVVIATKFGSARSGVIPRAGGSPASIERSLDASLRNLSTDYIDLWYFHFPDHETPIEETLGALHALVTAGKVRYIGCSNFSPEQLLQADADARAMGVTRFVALQDKYNLIERDAESALFPLCRDLNIGFVPYFPLASGLLTGKYTRGKPPPPGSRLAMSRFTYMLADELLDRVDTLREFAESHHRSLHELAIAGLACQPEVASVIVGATSPEQVRTNVAAAERELDPAELAELLALPRFANVDRRGAVKRASDTDVD